MVLFQEEKTGMSMKHKLIAKCVLIFWGIMLGFECLGSTVTPIRAQTSRLKSAAENYMVRNEGRTPDSLDELLQFTASHPSYAHKTRLRKEDLIDPWGEPIRYETNGRRFIVISSGPDRQFGTKDDTFDGSPGYVRSWLTEHYPSVDWYGTGRVQRATSETNVVQAATLETTQQPAGVEKIQTNRIPVTGGQSPTESAETENTPWKLPLLIGLIAVAGVIMAWRFRKKG